MKDILLRFQLSLLQIHGQCFDGASNMLGKRSGVAIQIYKEQLKAHYLYPLPLPLFNYKGHNKIF